MIASAPLSRRQQHESLRAQLELERASFIQTWRDANDFILPRRARFFTSDTNRGERRSGKIIDSTATLSARTLRAGMTAGVTSPARPWFKLTTPDPSVADVGAIKAWCHMVGQRMSTVFLRSNLYNALPIIYGDMGVFGTAAMLIEEDMDSIIRCYPLPIGSYSIANDEKLQVRVFCRTFRMTIRQLVKRFGAINIKTGEPDWKNFSQQVQDLWRNGNLEAWVDVTHIIQPNERHDPTKLHSKFKRYESVYYESGTGTSSNGLYTSDDREVYLSEMGYDYFPILCPRWEITGEDTYGTSCPGVDALGDIKQLQMGERRIAEAIEKVNRPPMTGPGALRNQKTTILPGDITYDDSREGKGFRPTYQVDPRIQEMEHKQEQVRQRIQRAFYEDLFLMLANDERSNITATEIAERKEEKLLALGPVLEQLNQDLLDPLIDITFDIMLRQGQIPDAPDELQGMPLKVEYVSIMAQAQKLVGIAGHERFIGMVGQIAQYDQRVLKKVKTTKFIDVYGDMTSVDPSIIASDEEVDQMMQAEQKAMAAQQMAETIPAAAGAAKTLSETPMDNDSALSRLMDQAQAGAIV